MLSLTAYAIAMPNGLEVTISGFLPSSCHHAFIDDYYPGKRVYVIDPGFAQVFVSITNEPSAEYCADLMVPWSTTIRLPDLTHARVQIFVNNRIELTIKVQLSSAGFIVVQLTGGIVPNGPFSIRPADTQLYRIYSKVFGPTSYDECDRWITAHTDKTQEWYNEKSLGYDLADNGVGGDNPRGFVPFLDEQLLSVTPSPRVDMFYGGGEMPRK